MINARVGNFIGYFKTWAEDPESGLKYFFYGDSRMKMDSVAAKMKYPAMLLEQPRIRTEFSGSAWYNVYDVGVAIVKNSKNYTQDQYINTSSEMFELLGLLIGKIKADQKALRFSHVDLKFVINEVDEVILNSHVGWAVEFRMMLPCGDWGRVGN